MAIALATGCSDPFAADAPPLSTPSPLDPAITQPAATASPSAGPAVAGRLQQVRLMLQDAARRHGLNPYLVMGLAWWESGWDQTKVSATGAVGVMQVEPYTADSAGPLLLHRKADVHDMNDNIELGTAVLKEDLDRFNGDLTRGLIAYYAGPPAASMAWQDLDSETQRYVLGVYRLSVEFSKGTGPV